MKNKIAIIQEDNCIGCTKCIQVCPVDAILGAVKQTHTVISEECTGCELCINSCPVNCIEMVPSIKLDDAEEQRKKIKSEQRINFRNFRLQRNLLEKTKNNIILQTRNVRKAANQAALLRAQEKNLYASKGIKPLEFKKNS